MAKASSRNEKDSLLTKLLTQRTKEVVGDTEMTCRELRRKLQHHSFNAIRLKNTAGRKTKLPSAILVPASNEEGLRLMQ